MFFKKQSCRVRVVCSGNPLYGHIQIIECPLHDLHGDLGRYAAAHRRIGRYPNAVTRLLLLVESRPRLRRRVMRSLAADPSLMSRFLALKMRAEGPSLFGSGGLLPLAAAALRGGM